MRRLNAITPGGFGFLAALASLGVGGCDEAAQGEPTQVSAIFVVALDEDEAPAEILAFDVSYFDAQVSCERVGRRALWRRGQGAALEIAIPCTPGTRLRAVHVTLADAFDAMPDDPGRFGEAGSPRVETLFDGPADVVCPKVSGRVVGTYPVTLGVRGFADIAINADTNGVGFGWTVNVTARDPRASWSETVDSKIYGDAAGSASYVGYCGLNPVGGAETVTVSVSPATKAPTPKANEVTGEPACEAGWHGIQLDVAVLNLHGLDEPGIEFWAPPLSKQVRCEANKDVFVPFGPVSVARLAREAMGNRARFGQLSCSAGWTCGGGPALTFSCTPDPVYWMLLEEPPMPVMVLDDLVVSCPGKADIRLDPAPLGELQTTYVGERPLLTWTVRPALDLTTLQSGCTLHTQGTAMRADGGRFGTVGDGQIGAGTIYPVVSWSVPARWAAPEECVAVELDTTGPIGISYTSGEATANRTFAHSMPEPIAPRP